MGRILSAAALGFLFLGGGFAQNAGKRLEYEAASIRPAAPDHPRGVGQRGGPGTADPTRVTYGYFPLRLLLMTAYDLTNYQIDAEAPIDGDRFDIVATIPAGTTVQQERVMLQNFLIDRFHIKLHLETRTLSRYELSIARNGPKLTPHPGPAPIPGGINVAVSKDHNQMMARGAEIKDLIRVISDDSAKAVLDKTGLTGSYDWSFRYSREGLDGFRTPGGQAPDPSDAPSLATALEESLGLKLELKRGPLEVLVVEAADKTPSQN